MFLKAHAMFDYGDRVLPVRLATLQADSGLTPGDVENVEGGGGQRCEVRDMVLTNFQRSI